MATFMVYKYSTSSPTPHPLRQFPRPPSGCLKPETSVPNPRYTMFFSYKYMPFHLQEAFYGFDISKLPASLISCFAATIKVNKVLEHKHCDTATLDLITQMAAK